MAIDTEKVRKSLKLDYTVEVVKVTKLFTIHNVNFVFFFPLHMLHLNWEFS